MILVFVVIFVARIVMRGTTGARIRNRFFTPVVLFITLTGVTWCDTGVTVTERFLSPALPLSLASRGIRAKLTVVIGSAVAAITVITAAVVVQFVRSATTKFSLTVICFLTQVVFSPAKTVEVSVFFSPVAPWTRAQKRPSLVAVEFARLCWVLHTRGLIYADVSRQPNTSSFLSQNTDASPCLSPSPFPFLPRCFPSLRRFPLPLAVCYCSLRHHLL